MFQSFLSVPNNALVRKQGQEGGCVFHSLLFGSLSAATALHLFFQENDQNMSTLCEGIPDEDEDEDESATWGRGEKSLKQIMDEHYDGKENWPWVWCHRNENGPLYVFSGVDKDTLWKCQQVADASSNNNLLLIATQEQIERHGATKEDFYKCRCGIHPGPVAELDLCNNILMLEDERVVEFDNLQTVQ